MRITAAALGTFPKLSNALELLSFSTLSPPSPPRLAIRKGFSAQPHSRSQPWTKPTEKRQRSLFSDCESRIEVVVEASRTSKPHHHNSSARCCVARFVEHPRNLAEKLWSAGASTLGIKLITAGPTKIHTRPTHSRTCKFPFVLAHQQSQKPAAVPFSSSNSTCLRPFPRSPSAAAHQTLPLRHHHTKSFRFRLMLLHSHAFGLPPTPSFPAFSPISIDI